MANFELFPPNVFELIKKTLLFSSISPIYRYFYHKQILLVEKGKRIRAAVQRFWKRKHSDQMFSWEYSEIVTTTQLIFISHYTTFEIDVI